ncbi:unnamed protein product [Bubo scandiacus]
MATTLEQALASGIATFHECSGEEADKCPELKELPSFMGEQLDKLLVLLKDLEDKDNTMDFKEYVLLLACLSMFCSDFCTRPRGPASRHRAPARGSNKTAVTCPALLVLGSLGWQHLSWGDWGHPESWWCGGQYSDGLGGDVSW